jgi:hypothetical protein
VAGTDEVSDWVKELPIWQQDLVCRAAQSVELDEEATTAALRVVERSFNIPTDGDAPPLLTFTSSLLNPHPLDDAVVLTAVGPLTGVGMVVPDGMIPISPTGLTIVYGQNATGKSSYVRALKALCRTVDTRPRIWGNAYSASPVPPRAKLTLSQSGEPQEIDTPLTGDDVHQLLGLSVFDSGCAELYVDQKNTFHYIPSELLVLTRLGALQDELRRRLKTIGEDLESHAPDLDSISEGTSAGQMVRNMRGRRVILTLPRSSPSPTLNKHAESNCVLPSLQQRHQRQRLMRTPPREMLRKPPSRQTRLRDPATLSDWNRRRPFGS